MVELERRASSCHWQEVSLKKWAVGTRLRMNFSLRVRKSDFKILGRAVKCSDLHA